MNTPAAPRRFAFGWAIVATVSLAVRASGQPAFPPPPGGMPNRPPGGDLTGGLPLPGEEAYHLLLLPEVRKELQYSEEMRANIALLGQEAREGDAKLRVELKGTAPADLPEKIQMRRLEVAKQIVQVIGSDKYRRLRQLQIQSAGLAVSLRSDLEVVEKLAVSADQQAEIRRKLRERSKEFGPPPSPDEEVESFDNKLLALRRKYDDAALSLLTTVQQAAWKDLVGREAAFALPMLGLPKKPPSRARGAMSVLPPILPGRQADQMLGNTDVLKDLNLGAGRTGELESLRRRLVQGDDQFRETHKGAARRDVGALVVERRKDVEAEVEKVIGPAGLKRIRQLQRQAAGLLPSLRADVEFRTLLEVSEAQMQKIREMIRSGDLPRLPPPTADMSQMRTMFREFRRKLDAALVDNVLTQEQRKRWNDAIGSPVDFELPPPPLMPIVERESRAGK